MPVTKSPLRYPGGKTQLSPFVDNLISSNKLKNCTYIEPFSGGAGVAIELLLSHRAEKIVLNDYDKSIYSLWYSILNHTDKLIELIEKTPISIESWHKQKILYNENKNYRNSIENGFATLFLNRTNRSGIINAGPIGGYSQDGNYKLDCRFNKSDLIKKIISISKERDRIDLYQKDTLVLIDIIKKRYCKESSFIFFDPPYFVQGNKLYTNFYKGKDHANLAKSISSLEDWYWITTYDNIPEIYDIYSQYSNIQKFEYCLTYSAQRKAKATEYLFSSKKLLTKSFKKIVLNKV